jgi:hypothetical protein
MKFFIECQNLVKLTEILTNRIFSGIVDPYQL